MTPNRAKRSLGQNQDRGAVLPLTLILTVVIAVVVTAIATYTSTALRTTATTEGRVDRLAAADSGMQEVLVQLEASGTCPTGLAARNGATLNVDQCRPETVIVNDTNAPFGMILTARGLNSGTDAFVRSGSAVEQVNVGGEVFVALTATGDTRNVLATGQVISQASVAASECEGGEITGPTWLGLDVSECTVNDWSHYTPVPSVPSTSPGPASIPDPNRCDRKLPGTYGNLSTSTGDGYFASGVYHITGTLEIRGAVTAGHPGAQTLGTSHRCHTAQAVDVANHVDHGGPKGALFVLEGGGNIVIDRNRATFEAYGLEDVEAGRTLSVIAYDEAPSGYAASTRNPQNQSLILNDHPNAAFTFFGEVWAPRGFMLLSQMSSSGAAGAAFQGGVTMSRFEANTSRDVSGLLIGSGEVITETHHRIRVTATSPDGASTTVSTVTRRPPEDDLMVQSWRVT